MRRLTKKLRREVWEQFIDQFPDLSNKELNILIEDVWKQIKEEDKKNESAIHVSS